MKFRCILFSLITSIAACSGDRSNPTEDRHPVFTPPKVSAPDSVPKLTAGFGSGDVVKPVIEGKAKSELPAIEHYIPAKFAECISLGRDLESKGDHARARELFEAAAKLDRKAAMPHIELARSYISTTERALAIRHASKAVKLAPESSLAFNTLGRAELLRNQYDAAAVAFRQATELDADNVWAWNNLGLVYLTNKDYQEAANALVEATSRQGTTGYMWNNLGTAYEQLDRLDDARDAFDHGAKLGSVAAKDSRKRLEGVDTVAVATKKPGKTDDSFETREPMPDVDDGPSPEDVIDVVDDEHHDGVVVDEVKKDEPKPEVKPDAKPEVKSEVKPEAKPEPTPDPKPSTTL